MKKKLQQWVQQFESICWLDNNKYKATATFDYMIAVHPHSAKPLENLSAVQEYIDQNQGKWIFGHLDYEFGASLFGNNRSKQATPISFPGACFFTPSVLLIMQHQQLTVLSNQDPNIIWQEINDTPIPASSASLISAPIQQRLTKATYIETVQQLQKHIQRGDCYEINFCQEFYIENTPIIPIEVYNNLTQYSPNPFSVCYRQDKNWLLSASPERFLCRTDSKLISQPIKGTIKRNLLNSEEDELLKQRLQKSAKDQAENVMVVDLVRNDISQCCIAGSVKVEELFGIYSYPQVHQMISTISGTLKPNINFTDIIRNCYPMGSMTGAPKKRVIELIDQYETVYRQLFSGTVGYIDPKGNFDFNVVIRSILYNEVQHYISLPAGSGITIYSNPEQEWEECLLKREAMQLALAPPVI